MIQVVSDLQKSGEKDKIREVIGIERVSEYILERGVLGDHERLFKEKTVTFEELDLTPPLKNHDKFVEENILDQTMVIREIFKRAGLISELESIRSLNKVVIGEDHGFTGTLYRISDIIIINEETKV